MTAYVFDFGGVLFRWRPARLLQRVWPGRVPDDASAAQWAQRIFGASDGGWADFDRGLVDPAALAERIAARNGLEPAEVRRLIDAVPDELQPLADGVALLDRLRRAGAATHYLSNMPRPYADHLERAHDFVRGFDAGVFSARVRLAKPDPAIYALAADRFGVPPADLVFFDDHPPNVDAARRAGWQAWHYTDAAGAEQALRGAGLWPGR